MAKLRRSLRKLAKTKLDDRQEDQERILTEVWRHQTTGLYLLATAKLTDSFIACLSYKCFYNVYIGVGGMGHFSPRGGPLFAPCTTLLEIDSKSRHYLFARCSTIKQGPSKRPPRLSPSLRTGLATFVKGWTSQLFLPLLQ